MGDVIGMGKAESFYTLRMWQNSLRMLQSRDDRHSFQTTIDKERRLFKKELSDFVRRAA